MEYEISEGVRVIHYAATATAARSVVRDVLHARPDADLSVATYDDDLGYAVIVAGDAVQAWATAR